MPTTFRRAQPNKTARFDELYDRHVKSLHAYLLGRTNDPELALDLVQEVFLRAWRHVRRVPQAADGERYWLFSVAKNLVRDHYRRAGRRAALAPRLPSGLVRAPQHDEPEANFESKEQIGQVAAAMQNLPEEMRTALVMHVLGGLSSAEIGTLLDKPAGTVRYWIHRARQLIGQHVGMSTDNEIPEVRRQNG